jgi:hypothetical protein
MNKNQYLFRLALLSDEVIKWHSHAEKENSSQAFCLSAFGSLRDPTFKSVRDHVVAHFLGDAFPGIKTAKKPRRWNIEVEVEVPELLNEYGWRTQPTSIDTLFTSSREVIVLEAKFDVDAKNGFGKCSQYSGTSGNACAGFYGPGSDLKGKTAAWCRLETWDGVRSPRLYWAMGRTFFRPEIFEKQNRDQECPFRGPNYQLMRNFLFAAAYAARNAKKDFRVAVVCSETCDEKVKKQLEDFRLGILLESQRERVGLIHYERLIEKLTESSVPVAKELAGFLAERIKKILGK